MGSARSVSRSPVPGFKVAPLAVAGARTPALRLDLGRLRQVSIARRPSRSRSPRVSIKPHAKCETRSFQTRRAVQNSSSVILDDRKEPVREVANPHLSRSPSGCRARPREHVALMLCAKCGVCRSHRHRCGPHAQSRSEPKCLREVWNAQLTLSSRCIIAHRRTEYPYSRLRPVWSEERTSSSSSRRVLVGPWVD
ncbi:hypothetical protein EXIGLDRAFT_504296 [Exidia glandulosa HHB12029]|uniref:Uncharacterized protein n=1 Tax=Exidia glandulosa HHB12029 TaxID=1314781 RepID=A0A166N599_EXIGL|nr:hypothetical protein EXIGLDRAFT_504296 [Exidia glandulosa HHB12029]